MIDQRIKATLVASALLSCAAAPEGFAQAGPDSGPKDNLLATLQLKDGSVAQFSEPAPGELVILMQIPVGVGKIQGTDAVNGIKFRDLNRLDAVGKYKALAGGTEVPAALVQAQQRVARAQRASVAAALKAGTAFKKQGFAVPMASPVASWFHSNHCRSFGYTFAYCKLNQTVNLTLPNPPRTSVFINSVIYPERGNVSHKLQHVDCPFLKPCVWRTSRASDVLQGHLSWIEASGLPTKRRATAYNVNRGDLYHWAVYGH